MGSTDTRIQQTVTGTGWLFSLMLVTFAIGTDDFVIAGVLPEIADDLDVSEAAAGQLVTVFSITYALAAPPLAVATARLPRKPLVSAASSRSPPSISWPRWPRPTLCSWCSE